MHFCRAALVHQHDYAGDDCQRPQRFTPMTTLRAGRSDPRSHFASFILLVVRAMVLSNPLVFLPLGFIVLAGVAKLSKTSSEPVGTR
jgi:hypothetical protein